MSLEEKYKYVIDRLKELVDVEEWNDDLDNIYDILLSVGEIDS